MIWLRLLLAAMLAMSAGCDAGGGGGGPGGDGGGVTIALDPPGGRRVSVTEGYHMQRQPKWPGGSPGICTAPA